MDQNNDTKKIENKVYRIFDLHERIQAEEKYKTKQGIKKYSGKLYLLPPFYFHVTVLEDKEISLIVCSSRSK